MMRLAWIVGTLIAATAVAGARPPPPPEDPPTPTRPGLEWSTWVRMSYGVAPYTTDRRRAGDRGLAEEARHVLVRGRGRADRARGHRRHTGHRRAVLRLPAPWDLLRPRHREVRYQIGLRAVATYTRSIDDPRDWTSTVGLEVEPVGALRYLLGIRGWY
jgi:hypothetical protein